MEEDVVAPLPRLDGAFLDRQLLVRDDQVRVEEHLGADAVAGRAGAGRVVEREQPRRDLRVADAAGRAGELLGEEQVVSLERRDLDDAVGQLGRQLDRIGQALADAVLLHQPVDEHLDGVRLVVPPAWAARPARPARRRCWRARTRPGAASPARRRTSPLLLAHHRRQHREARALGQLQHLVDHLLDRLRRDRLAAVVAVDGADARPQQAQVVVDLGHRADGRARVARAGLLLDRDRRRQPLDRIDVGLVHLVEELPRVRRQRLDVAALPLGVDRVERERRLARARQPGDHHQLVARDLDVDVLEVVLARALDDDLFHRDGGAGGGPDDLTRQFPYSRDASPDRISSAFTLTPNPQHFLAPRRRRGVRLFSGLRRAGSGQRATVAAAAAADQQPGPEPDEEHALRVIVLSTRPPTVIVVWPLPRATGF